MTRSDRVVSIWSGEGHVSGGASGRMANCSVCMVHHRAWKAPDECLGDYDAVSSFTGPVSSSV